LSSRWTGGIGALGYILLQKGIYSTILAFISEVRRCSVLNQKVGKGLTSSPFAVVAHDSRELKNDVGE
jgi:hypothetical protein